MFFVALATDYDDTIATHGMVDTPTLEALKAVKNSGRRLVMVTGRELDDLLSVFADVGLFDLIVAENGALLFDPETNKQTQLAPSPSREFIEHLQRSNTSPLSVGRSIVATWQPNEINVLNAIRDLGLEYQIIFNKGAVMVLPPGVNKATGLAAALRELGLSRHNVVGVGDAENDHAFLQCCGCSVAVENALPSVKESADFITATARGAGVAELAKLLVETDLATLGASDHLAPLLGHSLTGDKIRLRHSTGSVLVVGSSGGGKSTVVHGLIERLQHSGHQCCVIDPEGDFSELDGIVTVGSAKQPPQLDAIRSILDKPDASVAINLLAIKPNDRPAYFADLLGEILQMRTETGRPHWLILDEAHHLMPADWGAARVALPAKLDGTIMVTVEVDALSSEAISRVNTVVAVGNKPGSSINKFFSATGQLEPGNLTDTPGAGLSYFWRRDSEPQVQVIKVEPPTEHRRRHARKYAEGELGADKSFYFRGPNHALNLRAQNLMMFVQIAAGVDDATWLHHLKAGDYSKWFDEAIKDTDLAGESRAIEQDPNLSAADSRALIGRRIASRYTAPAHSS